MTAQAEKIGWLEGLPKECSELEILLKNGSTIQISPACIRHDSQVLHIVPQKYIVETGNNRLTVNICELQIQSIRYISAKDNFGKCKFFIR